MRAEHFLKNKCAPSETPDQPVHTRSLIRFFTRHSKGSQEAKALSSGEKDWSGCEHACWLIWVFSARAQTCRNSFASTQVLQLITVVSALLYNRNVVDYISLGMMLRSIKKEIICLLIFLENISYMSLRGLKICVVAISAQWAHNIKMTSYQRRCDVITSHRRWYDVILMLCACWASCCRMNLYPANRIYIRFHVVDIFESTWGPPETRHIL